jgi:predicted 3-demethylubiquinone-9 3-methyltransferase (glyoxalase superfamily)
VSKDGSGNPTQIIKERLEEYIANPETIVSVMAHVTKINIDFKS